MPRRNTPNAEQMADRLGMVRECLAACMASHEIESSLAAEWKVDRRTIRGYMKRVRDEAARVKLVSLSSEERATEQNLVIDGLKRSIAAAWSKTDGRNREAPDLKAVQRGYELLGKIYGVYADRLELSGPGGGAIPFAGHPGLTKMLHKLEADAKAKKAAAPK